MTAPGSMVFEQDLANNKLNIQRSFEGSLDRVWEAWTDSSILDQWWAPKPYRAETKSMDFREGGAWIYCMVGPEGDRQWCKEIYHSILPKQKITCTDGFCDEDGNDTIDFPKMHWMLDFDNSGTTTTVDITISFDKKEDMDKYLEMGFKEGFEAGLNNLDDVLANR